MKKSIIGVSILAIAGGSLFYMTSSRKEAAITSQASYCYNELVCDSEKLFSAEQNEQLTQYHAALLRLYDIDLRVHTVNTSSDQAVNIFKPAKIGEKSKTRKGLLLLINPKHNIVRLEVSAGLDAIYTDGFVAYIQQKQMIPFFQANQVANGILATTEMVVTRAQEAIAGKAFIPPEQLPQNLAIGAGAQTKASIGTGYQTPQSSNPTVAVLQGAKPEDVVALYHKSLVEGNTAYDLPIYSKSAQEMRKTWVVTPAQMKNELNAYKACNIDKIAVLNGEKNAVVRYKIDQHQCAPYFLVKEDGAWRLEFNTMMKHIRFGIDNAWHFDMRQKIPYADAFTDWQFNRNGFPIILPKMRWGISVTTDPRRHITFVAKIYADTPAASMELKEGDIIMNWDGIENPNNRQMMKLWDSAKEGQKIKVQVWRNGQKLMVEVIAPPRV